MVPDQKYCTIYTSNGFLNHAFAENFSCISKTSESPLLSISVFPITHPLLCSILHVAKKNVQLYMPNLNGLAKSTGNVNRKYSPIYLGI